MLTNRAGGNLYLVDPLGSLTGALSRGMVLQKRSRNRALNELAKGELMKWSTRKKAFSAAMVRVQLFNPRCSSVMLMSSHLHT